MNEKLKTILKCHFGNWNKIHLSWRANKLKQIINKQNKQKTNKMTKTN